MKVWSILDWISMTLDEAEWYVFAIWADSVALCSILLFHRKWLYKVLIRENPNGDFWNFLIPWFCPKFTWGISLITHLRICPVYLLGVMGSPSRAVLSDHILSFKEFMNNSYIFCVPLFTFVKFYGRYLYP